MKKILILLIVATFVSVSILPFNIYAEETSTEKLVTEKTDSQATMDSKSADTQEEATTSPNNLDTQKEATTSPNNLDAQKEATTSPNDSDTQKEVTNEKKAESTKNVVKSKSSLTDDSEVIIKDENSLIPDDNLRTIINTMLGKPSTYQPTEAELNNLTGILDLTDETFTTLDGLQYLKKVKTLQCVGVTAPDADLAYIGQMSSLTRLTVNTSSFETTTGLEPLRNLIYFDWSSNGKDVVHGQTAMPRNVYNFDFLVNNKSLNELSISVVYSTDPTYAFLSELTGLTRLTIVLSNMNNVSSIKNLTNLTSLNLNNNYIADMSPLENQPIFNKLSATGQSVILPAKEVWSGENLTIDKPIKPELSTINYTLPSNPTTTLEENSILMSNITKSSVVNYNVYNYKTGTNDIVIPGVLMEFQGTTPNFSGKIIQPLKVKERAADVKVLYVDEAGNEIATSEILTGELDTPYSTKAKIIEGFKLKETPTNCNGIFSKDEQTVTYVYEIADGAPVTVKYVDENGKKISEDTILVGKKGTKYTSTPKDIKNYTLKEMPKNATGIFTSTNQTVTYVYSKNMAPIPETSAPVIVRYVDTNGAEIADSITLVGELDDPYQTSEKIITGYKLTKVPTNKNGVYTVNTQIVTYEYEKVKTTSNGDKEQTKKVAPTSSNHLPKTGDTTTENATLLFAGVLLVIAGTIVYRKKGKHNH